MFHMGFCFLNILKIKKATGFKKLKPVAFLFVMQ